MSSTMTATHAAVDDDPRRSAILRQARRHFMTQGYAATRIEPIAREAAVSTATLYTYFASKEALFSAVIAFASDAFADEMAKVIHGAEGRPAISLTAVRGRLCRFHGRSVRAIGLSPGHGRAPAFQGRSAGVLRTGPVGFRGSADRLL